MAERRIYLRPLPIAAGRSGARPLAGGPLEFAEVAVRRRGAPEEILPADAVEALYPEAAETLARLSAPRPPLLGLAHDRPRIMGVVNVTPDSFSDGGRHDGAEAAIAHGLALLEAGAHLLDIGGESTRPGAEPVPEIEELDRVLPVIRGLKAAGCTAALSIDTRKAGVAEAARAAGAVLFNDVSALTYDEDSAGVAASYPALCLMHAQGDPQTMQDDPRYGDVLLDVYDFLEERIAAAPLPRARILADPGIGFGKTLAHNVTLLRGLSLFLGLGCPVLLGASRKRFIGTLTEQPEAARRAPGSVAAALHGLGQGAQWLRVHDVRETAEAARLWHALNREAP